MLNTIRSSLGMTMSGDSSTATLCRVNTIHERAKLNKRLQKPHESPKAVIKPMFDIAKLCGFW